MNANKTTKKKIANRLGKYSGKVATNPLALKIARDVVAHCRETDTKAKVRRFTDEDVAKIRETCLKAFNAWTDVSLQNAAAVLGDRNEMTLVQALEATYTLAEKNGRWHYAGDMFEIRVRCHDKFWWSLSRKTVHHKREIFVEWVRAGRM